MVWWVGGWVGGWASYLLIGIVALRASHADMHTQASSGQREVVKHIVTVLRMSGKVGGWVGGLMNEEHYFTA